MPLGLRSLEKLADAVPVLQDIIREAALGVDEGDLAYAGITDTSVQTGFRGKAEQSTAFVRGDSKVQWPNSAHNTKPTKAVDFVPFPELWSDPKKLETLRSYVCGIAHARGVDLKDIDWDPAHIEVA